MSSKISIVMPVYNAEKFLEKAINSVINQTYENIELICVNDGSKDKSLEILNEFALKDSRVKVFSQENAGISVARNTGMKNASGKYLMFIDNDDSYEPEMCEYMLKAIEDNDVDCAICDTNIHLIGRHGWDKFAIEYHTSNMFGHIEVKPAVIPDIRVLVWNKIFKKELCDKYSITFPPGRYHEDSAFIYQYFSVAKSAFGIEQKLYNYSIRANSSVSDVHRNKNPKIKYDYWYSLKHVVEFLHRNNMLQYHINPLFKCLMRCQKRYWGCLNEDEKNFAVDIIMDMFNKDDTALADSSLPFFRILKSKDKQRMLDLLNEKIVFLERIFSIKENITHKCINFLGLRFKLRYAY